MSLGGSEGGIVLRGRPPVSPMVPIVPPLLHLLLPLVSCKYISRPVVLCVRIYALVCIGFAHAAHKSYILDGLACSVGEVGFTENTMF